MGGNKNKPPANHERYRDGIVWVDLEMSGLDLRHDVILEIAVIITDKDLNVVGEGPELVLHASDDILNGMDDWCTKHHGESGLTQRSRESKLSVEEAEQQVLKFVKKYVVPKTAPLGGNSVHVDRQFMCKYMPKLTEYLHYRIVDCSTIKEMTKRWMPRVKNPPKKLAHRALDDILESIEELRFYRDEIFSLHPLHGIGLGDPVPPGAFDKAYDKGKKGRK